MAEDTLPLLPPRPARGHKGTFGTVCVLGGQADAPQVMIGGPALTATAALRAGAGLVVLAVPAPLMAAGLSIAPSATGLALPADDDGSLRPSDVAELLDEHLPRYDCVAFGPGFGDGPAQRQIAARLVGREHPPMVIDADALNALAGVRAFQRDFRVPAVLTPHPGEYARLARALGIDADPVDPASRAGAAEALAQRVGCVVVLKGAGTVVSDGLSTWTNTTGNPALATAGTGDVLTGVIAGLVAQYASGPDGPLSLFDCARLGVFAHGMAADRWREAHADSGMLAADLLDRLPDVLASLRGR
jgi:NAD(P)H-hydrate epimerase